MTQAGETGSAAETSNTRSSRRTLGPPGPAGSITPAAGDCGHPLRAPRAATWLDFLPALRGLQLVLLAGGLLATGACRLETIIFPIFDEPFLLDAPPAELGPFGFTQRRIEVENLGDGDSGGLTIFEPVGATGPRPALVWILGVNNRAHFHQSFHEYMASWGYVEIVPDTRDIDFTDTRYHARNIAIAREAFRLARSGELGVNIATDRVALGGYSVGASLAALAAADETEAQALLLWAPSPALIWQGVKPEEVLPNVRQPTLFLLAEFDNVVGDWPQTMQSLMIQSEQTVTVIANGVHLYFQQPPSVDDRNPNTPITRPEQMRQAFENSRGYLDEFQAPAPF